MYIAENPSKRPPKTPVFNAEIVQEAVRKSKQHGKQKRSTKTPKDNGHNNSIVRDGDPPDVLQENNAAGTDSGE